MSVSDKSFKAQVFPAATVVASFNTVPTTVPYFGSVTYEIIYTNATGIPSGTFAVQVANGFQNQNPSTLVWNTLTLSGTPTVDAVSGAHEITILQFPFGFCRLVYTANASTSCTLAINIQVKDAS